MGHFEPITTVPYGAAPATEVDGYAVPVDPMDDLQCESCQ